MARNGLVGLAILIAILLIINILLLSVIPAEEEQVDTTASMVAITAMPTQYVVLNELPNPQHEEFQRRSRIDYTDRYNQKFFSHLLDKQEHRRDTFKR